MRTKMRARNFRTMILLPAALLLAAAPVIHAEEGMWTFDNPPLKLLKAKYNFTPTQAWLDHLRLSSVRLNDGGSGSFVSPTACYSPITTWRGPVAKRTRRPNTIICATGFLAATPDQEMRSADLEVNVLVAMEDVTPRVQGAVKGVADDAKARRRGR